MILKLDLTGTQVRHPHINAAITALGSDTELFKTLAFGVDCVAWFMAPTADSPRLSLTWAPANTAPIGDGPGLYWAPFYRFQANHSPAQHVHRMLYALKTAPILLNGEYTPVDYRATVQRTAL